MKTHGPWPCPPDLPQLTADRDAALLPLHSGERSVAPGPSDAAIWVAAKILPQVSPRVGGRVDSGIENCSAEGVSPTPSVSSPPILSPLADRPAHHSLRLMWVATPPQLAFDA